MSELQKNRDKNHTATVLIRDALYQLDTGVDKLGVLETVKMAVAQELLAEAVEEVNVKRNLDIPYSAL